MNDSASAISMGYGESTMQYAFAVLSTEMPSMDAAHVLLAATRDDCPTTPTTCRITGNRRKMAAERLRARPSQPRKHLGDNRIRRHRDLIARREVLDPDRAGLDVAVADHQCDPGTGTVGRAHRALEPAVTVGHVDADTGGAQLPGQHRQPQLGRLAQRHAEHVATRGLPHALALGAQRQQGPVHAEPKSDARQVLSAELAHQAVVAAAAADARTARPDRRARTRTWSWCSNPARAPSAG